MNHHYRGVISRSKSGRITNTSVSVYLNTLFTCINVPLSETGERPRYIVPGEDKHRFSPVITTGAFEVMVPSRIPVSGSYTLLMTGTFFPKSVGNSFFSCFLCATQPLSFSYLSSFHILQLVSNNRLSDCTTKLTHSSYTSVSIIRNVEQFGFLYMTE